MQRNLKDSAPLVMFVFSVSLLSFVYGYFVCARRIFPYEVIHSAKRTAQAVMAAADEKGLARPLERRLTGADVARFESPSSLGFEAPIIVTGGRGRFHDHCGGHGCLAVRYDETGNLKHAYPYRPEEIFEANSAGAHPYEAVDFHFPTHARPIGIRTYADGDLLVTFQTRGAFPYSGGVARITPDGSPVWFRMDYSHHWPSLTGSGIALVPALEIGGAEVSFSIEERNFRIPCNTGKMYEDTVQFIGPDGAVTRKINVLRKLIDSSYRVVLQQTTDPCDPTHLNHVNVIRERITDPRNGAVLAEKGDLVVSLRNVSAFGILERNTGDFRFLRRGNFFQQHSVKHLAGTRFLMFDNHGSDKEGGPSRLLMVDIGNGRERTVFPNGRAPEDLRKLFSNTLGQIAISPSGKRALATFSNRHVSVEVRLSDGKALNVFRSRHPVPDGEDGAIEIEPRTLYGVSYAVPDAD